MPAGDTRLKRLKCCVSTEQGNSLWKLLFFHFINENRVVFVGKAFNAKLFVDICIVPCQHVLYLRVSEAAEVAVLCFYSCLNSVICI